MFTSFFILTDAMLSTVGLIYCTYSKLHSGGIITTCWYNAAVYDIAMLILTQSGETRRRWAHGPTRIHAPPAVGAGVDSDADAEAGAGAAAGGAAP